MFSSEGMARPRRPLPVESSSAFPTISDRGLSSRASRARPCASWRLRVAASFDFRGLGHVEFKWDSRDGEFKFLEVNPRTSVCSLHPLACGANFPWLAYLESTGQPSSGTDLEYRAGVVWVIPEVRLLRMRRVRMPRQAPSWWPWARCYTQAVLSPARPPAGSVPVSEGDCPGHAPVHDGGESARLENARRGEAWRRPAIGPREFEATRAQRARFGTGSGRAGRALPMSVMLVVRLQHEWRSIRLGQVTFQHQPMFAKKKPGGVIGG